MDKNTDIENATMADTTMENTERETDTTMENTERESDTVMENTAKEKNGIYLPKELEMVPGEVMEEEIGQMLLLHHGDEDDADDDQDDPEETRCGFGPFKPAWLQPLARKEVYMVVFSVVGLTQGIFFTYMVSVLSTIEKRFKFTSKETGTILAGNDVSQIVLSIVLGYYGNYGHRPRWVAVGVLFAALAGFLAALPHLMYGAGDEALAVALAATAGTPIHLLDNLTAGAPAKKEEVCHFQPEDVCEAVGGTVGGTEGGSGGGTEGGSGGGSGEPFMGPLVLFFSSQFFFGVTLSIFYSLGVTYLDDNVNKKAYPMYYSAAFMLRILGPVIGFFVGGKCLSVWIDPSQQPNITRKDPRWYGAWWIGFLVIGFGLLLTGNLLVLFPRKLPGTQRREHKRALRLAERDRQAGGKRDAEFFSSLARTQRREAKPTLRNLLKGLKRLFTNKIWVGNLFNTTVYVLGVSGYWNFKPKYLETQFRQSPTTASYFTGLASLVSLVLGTGLGGAVLRWAHPGPRFVTGYNIFITLLTCCSYIILAFIGCPRLSVLGPVDGSVSPGCSADCGCSLRYSPVCSLDNTTLFYSACYAGCVTVNATASPMEYGECQCIEDIVSSTHPPLTALPTTHSPLTTHPPLTALPTTHSPLTTHPPFTALPTTHTPLTTHQPLPTTHTPLYTTHSPLTTHPPLTTLPTPHPASSPLSTTHPHTSRHLKNITLDQATDKDPLGAAGRGWDRSDPVGAAGRGWDRSDPVGAAGRGWDRSDPVEAASRGWGRSGYCPEPCDKFFYYIIIQMVIKTVASTGRVGSNLIHLRSVADEDKGLALGTLNVFLSVFAFIPAPIMMGAIIDSACLVWDKKCGRSGNCWLYDTDKFRLILHLVPAAFIFVSVFGDLVVFYYSHQLDLYGEKDDDKLLENTRHDDSEEAQRLTKDAQNDHEKATQKEEEEAEEGELVDLQLPPTPSSASFTTSTRIGGDDDDDDDERPWTRVFLHYGDNLDFARCSIRSFRPQWLQVLARQEVYLLLYCLLGVTHGVIHTFVISVISTIEKNFRLSSKQTGVVLAGSGAAQATVSALLPLYGRSVHRGRWSGVGVVAGVASCMLALASQVVYGSGGTTRDASGQMEKTEVCFSGGTREDEESCDALAGESYIGPVVLLFISQFFVGIAISIFYSIGVTYLDDNINKHSPQYLGITLLLRVVGPVCGFLLGGSCLWVWVHPFQDPPDQARDDPRWLGSWWIGFLLVGCCVLVLGGLLFLFRHKVALTRRGARPGRRRRASTRLWKIDEFTIFTTMWKEATLSIQDLPKILKRLFNNKIWVGHLLSSVAFFLALACYYNFKTKYLETEFRKSASEANFYTGLVTLVGSLLGMAVSTALGKWAPQGPRFLASCDILFSVLVCTSFLGLMFIGCPRLQVVGPGEGTGEGACSAECGCSDRFSPLCLVQDQTILFYSACYAGCLTVDASSMPLVYGSCLCISHGANSLTQLDLPGTAGLKSAVLNMTATSGYCPEPCGYFVYYLAVQVLTNTIYATGRLGDSLIYLRGASEEDKEVSLGTIAVFVSLFGILPAPIIMGAAIDWTCSVWEKQCGEAGHCWLYATHAFRLLLHLIPAVFTFLSVFGEVVVFYYSHKLDLYGDRDDDVTIEKPEDTSTEDDEKAKCLTSTSARRLTSIP